MCIEKSLGVGLLPGLKTGIPFNARLGIGLKSSVIGISLLMGACATTQKQASNETVSTPTAATQVVAAEEKPAPSAKELMKTLKAPVTVSAAAPTSTSQTITANSNSVTNKADETLKAAETNSGSLSEQAVTKVAEESQKMNSVVAVSPVIVQKVEEVQPQVQMAKQVEPFSITKKKLPFKYDIWTIREGNTALTKGLVIMTPTWEMGKEGYMSQIWFTLMEDKIHVNSSSDIETKSKGLGIKIDGGELIPFSSIVENNIAVLNGKWLDRFAAAKKVEVYLGFFPGKKPLSDTFSSDLSMTNLAKMVATYRVLNK